MWVTEEIVMEEICYSISTYCSKRTCQNCAGPYLLCGGWTLRASKSATHREDKAKRLEQARAEPSISAEQHLSVQEAMTAFSSCCSVPELTNPSVSKAGSWATPPIKVNGGTGSARSTTAFNFWVSVRYLKHLYWSLLHQLRYRFRVSPYRFRARGNPTTLSATLWSYPILRDAQIILHVASRYIIHCLTFVLH